MAIAFTEFLKSVGLSVQDAQSALEQYAVQSFLRFFKPASAADGEDGLCAVEPITRRVILPGEEGETPVDLPMAVMAHHNTLQLDTVTVRLNAKMAVRQSDNALLLEPSPLAKQDGAADGEPSNGEVELVFRGSAASEGLARVNQSLLSQL